MAEITKNKYISSLIKLSITFPFLAVMYYLSTGTKDIDSSLKLLSGLFWVIIWFISFLFSVLLMGGFLHWNFESAKNKDKFPAETKDKRFIGIERFSYEFWIPLVYTIYNVMSPIAIFILRKLNPKEMFEYFNSRSFREILFNDPSPQGRLKEFGLWLFSCLLSIISPIQNFTSQFGPWMNNLWVQGVLIIISVLCMISMWSFSFKTSKMDGSDIDENDPLYICYKFIVDRLSLWMDAISSGNIKVVWPWQKNWEKKAIWQPIFLCVITLIGVYLMYSKNYNIISIFNQTIGEGGSILTLLNVVIPVSYTHLTLPTKRIV